MGGLGFGRYFTAGTPAAVADTIEKWLDEDDIDGTNLTQFLSFATARDFIELVVPELRRRGRFRERYEPGEALRERLLGTGRTGRPRSCPITNSGSAPKPFPERARIGYPRPSRGDGPDRGGRPASAASVPNRRGHS